MRIGSIVVDLRYSRLSREGRDIPLPPRAFDLLALFLSRPGVLLSREDIFRLVWKDVLVEDANLTQTVWLLRRALGDEGKAWIRTVSKRGYVFEGPLVEVVEVVEAPERPGDAMAAEPPPAHDVVADIVPVLPGSSQAPQSIRQGFQIHKRMLWRLSGAGLFLLALAVMLWWPDALVPGGNGRIVIVDAVGESVSEPLTDAVTLAHEWIGWQLGDRRLLDVVPAARSAGAGEPHRNDQVLLLSAHADTDPARMIVDAQLVGRGGGSHWQSAGATGDLPALVDALSRKVIDGIAADPAAGDAFDLPEEAAHRYAEAVRLRNDGRLAAALAQLEEVVRLAPHFPLARLQLAVRLAGLGQVSAAREHVAALSAWIDKQPAAARELLTVQLAAIRQEFRAAADGYAALARHHPRQWRFRIEEARSLLAGGRADEALDVLGSQGFDVEIAALQAECLLLRAQAQFALGALRMARASAERAAVLSRHAEDADVAAHAQLLVALVDVTTSGTAADVDALLAAGRQLDAQGDEFGALRAKIAAATLGSTFEKDDARTAVEALLAKARAAGNAPLEIQALRNQSRLALRERDFAAYRHHLSEARLVADAAGDRTLARGVEADLLYDEILRGDYATAERHSAAWRGEPLRALDGIDFGLNDALRMMREGKYADALDLLDVIARANGKAGEGSTAPTVLVSRLDCWKGFVRLRQGSIENARQRFSVCADALSPRDRFRADMGVATLSMLTGDIEGARERVNAVSAQVAQAVTPSERIVRITHLVPLLLRLGETEQARRYADDDLSYAQLGDFRLLQCLAWLRKAEVALIEGQVDAAGSALEQARALLPPSEWIAAADLKLLDAVVALARGDEQTALSVLRRLTADARARGDIFVQIVALDLVPGHLDALDSGEAAYHELIATTGLRGASLRWLLPARH